MKKYIAAFIMFACAVVLGLSNAQAARTETIAAVVNNDAITATDVDERLRLLMISSGIPNSAEIREKLLPQIMNILIEEQLMLQEANRLEINITKEEVDSGFAQLAQQNGMDVEKFKAMVRKSGVPPRAMERQIKAQMAWGKVVQQKIRPGIAVNDLEVDTMIARLRESIGKNEFLVGEIFLAVENPEEQGDVSQLAYKLTKEMLQGKVPFPRVAAQFSQSASSKRGGDIGWIQEGQLAPEIEEVLVRMNEGDLSEPIKTLSGYYIITLRKKRVIAEDNIPSRDELYHRMGTERLERAQRRHLLDLKSEAFIERRV